jgi:hypothetical protein
VIHVAYKHLDSKLKIADLTLGQWAGIALGVALAIVWGLYVSPLGTYLTFVSAVYIGALPAGASMLASLSEFDLLLLVRSMLAWRRNEGRFVPGAGSTLQGYVVEQEERDADDADTPELDLAALWET